MRSVNADEKDGGERVPTFEAKDLKVVVDVIGVTKTSILQVRFFNPEDIQLPLSNGCAS